MKLRTHDERLAALESLFDRDDSSEQLRVRLDMVALAATIERDKYLFEANQPKHQCDYQVPVSTGVGDGRGE